MPCSICQDIYIDPRVLPCGHSCCLLCLTRLQQRRCPVCRQQWSTSPSQLPVNYALLEGNTSLPVTTVNQQIPTHFQVLVEENKVDLLRALPANELGPVTEEQVSKAIQRDQGDLLVLLLSRNPCRSTWEDIVVSVQDKTDCRRALVESSWLRKLCDDYESCRRLFIIADQELLRQLLFVNKDLVARCYDRYAYAIRDRKFLLLASDIIQQDTDNKYIMEWLNSCCYHEDDCDEFLSPFHDKLKNLDISSLPITSSVFTNEQFLYQVFQHQLLQDSKALVVKLGRVVGSKQELSQLYWQRYRSWFFGEEPLSIWDLVSVQSLVSDDPDDSSDEEEERESIRSYIGPNYLHLLLLLQQEGFNILRRNKKNQDISAFIGADTLRGLVQAGVKFYLGDNSEGYNPADIYAQRKDFASAFDAIAAGCLVKPYSSAGSVADLVYQASSYRLKNWFIKLLTRA